MKSLERPDDFATRRAHLRGLSDAELVARFWTLTERIVAPLVEEARSHTTPAIERAVLLRMGFTGAEAKALVEGIGRRGRLGEGAGRLILELGRRHGASVRDVGEALLAGGLWEELAP